MKLGRCAVGTNVQVEFIDRSGITMQCVVFAVFFC